MKICIICKVEKDYICYSKDKSRKDGYSNKCKECRKIFNTNNKEKDIKYREKNKKKLDNYSKNYYLSHREEHLERMKIWERENKDKSLKYRKIRHKFKYENDEQYKLLFLLRTKLCQTIKGKQKSKVTLKLLGCSIYEFKQYLEKQFKEGMEWSNHGSVWEIDHIKPCSSFNLIDPEEQKKCFHYTNMQPLFKTTEIAEQLGYTNYIGNRNKYNKI